MSNRLCLSLIFLSIAAVFVAGDKAQLGLPPPLDPTGTVHNGCELSEREQDLLRSLYRGLCFFDRVPPMCIIAFKDYDAAEKKLCNGGLTRYIPINAVSKCPTMVKTYEVPMCNDVDEKKS